MQMKPIVCIIRLRSDEKLFNNLLNYKISLLYKNL
jgi:hypothetical protein